MRAKEFTFEAKIGTEPKRPARAGSRPDRGHKQEPRYKTQSVSGGSLREFAMGGDDGEDPTDNYPCYDCGSTIFLHHTKLCELAEDNATRDLPAEPGSQHWTGRIPKGLRPIPGLEQGVAEGSSTAMAQAAKRLTDPKDGATAKLRAAGDKRREDNLKSRNIAKKNESEQFCEDCGGSLSEAGKASRELCKSSKPDADLGASNLASCKSQGLRARDGEKSHKLGKGPKSRVTVGGHRIKGRKYGGPLPDYS